MSTGGYQGPTADFTPTGFGSDSPETSSRNGASASVINPPLFAADYKRHEDLKSMLDSSKDGQKREAMKLIIGMVAKGKDCADLFPAVVKNVVSKDSEIKKLVYVYLVRYAEEQQDLALLSISTFQKGLKDPNQLIRASALRVLSSIRVPIIAPIMMLAIKESVTDMSPFVRKTAAHAIPKLFSLDPELKDELVEVIEKLLKDQTTLVAGSVVMAFETVCPDRIDMIHKNYRKLCNLLVDVDEWGQVMIINMLTRYARTQFANPNQEEVAEDAPFYVESEEEEEEEESEEEESGESGDEEGEKKKKKKKPKKKKGYTMDPDHRLLLKNAKPLLQSRNAAVVMGVAQLYHHVAPRNEFGIIVKPLIRLLKGHVETQAIVLSNIATISADRCAMFEPYLKSFYIHSSDPTNIRLLKLDIIANVAGESSIHTILREFRTYISSPDKQFAAATIEAIGRVACSISEVTETCLHGLMSLLSHKSENVVAQSVVVIKKLLQLHPKQNKDLIDQVARLADSVTVPMAKASILWLVGEYCSLVPKMGPDVLRKAAKNFVNESDIVKLQTVNLAAKLVLSNPKQTRLLCDYVLSLAKYDQNYDIRDNPVSSLNGLFLQGEETALSKYAKKILLAPKPAPVLESAFKDRIHWQLGSLSHAVNSEATGYMALSDFPAEPPDPSVRNVEDDSWWGKTKEKKKNLHGDSDSEASNFYSSISGSDVSGSDNEGSEEGSGSESESGEESEEEEEEEGETSSDEEDALEKLKKRFGKKIEVSDSEESEEESEEEEEEESSEEESETETSSDEEEETPRRSAIAKPKVAAGKTAKSSALKPTAAASPRRSEEPSLLDFDGWDSVTASTPNSAPLNSYPISTATAVPGASTNLLQPLTNQMAALATSSPSSSASSAPPSTKPFTQEIISAVHTPKKTYDLLNRITGNGLAVTYHFCRRSHITSSKMVAIDVTFQNCGDSTLSGIRTGSPQLQSGMRMSSDVNIKALTAGTSQTVTVGIDFNDTLQPAKFEISVAPGKRYPVQIDPLVGELLRPMSVSEDKFMALKGIILQLYTAVQPSVHGPLVQALL
ncbi:AP-3 complex subunit beta-2 [Geodia barretti]|uniref:AP-3 complex subunit beta n=1 Tax=Geodia barretti TaxID=519541 RepID=A0AA35QY16_GEOBA|nr:AP-3 complex subunit beta-2 [Geodia barretti]